MARPPSCVERCRRHGPLGPGHRLREVHGRARRRGEPCNEFDAVNLRRRHRRPERYGITQPVSGTGVLVKVAFGNTGNSTFNGQHPVRSGLCIRVLHLEPIGRAAGTIGESLSASRCESSRAVTPSCGSGALMPLIRGMATLAASSSSAADGVCRHLSAARLRWYAHAPALLRCRPTR